MKYLENAFSFLGKYFVIVIPLFLASVIPAIIGGSASVGLTQKMQELQGLIVEDPALLQNPTIFFDLFAPLFMAASVSAFIGLVLSIIVTPATYGMVNKALATGNADLNDFLPQLKNNFVKYILYGVCSIILFVVLAIVTLLLFFVFTFLVAVLKALGVVLLILFIIALICFYFAFSFLITLWFPAMVVDDLDVFAAVKKSFSVVKSYFWPIVGITLLVGIGGAIVGMILGFFSGIPVIGGIIATIAPTLTSFILLVFYLDVYRDKTGKNGYADQDTITENPGNYL